MVLLLGCASKIQNLVCFRDKCFDVNIVKTEVQRNQGLMFRESLDQGKGMLFVFENEGKYQFWMKNTLIPLDIIWLNKYKEVVFISKNTSPCKEDCETIIPDKEALYVLELNAGTADKIGLKIRDKLNF